jgi:hypothetical protein
MIEARKRGEYAVVRYDKLIIDGNVYCYDENMNDIKFIRKYYTRSTRSRTHGDLSQQQTTSLPNSQRNQSEQRVHPGEEREHEDSVHSDPE